jgi:hypothetical protein
MKDKKECKPCSKPAKKEKGKDCTMKACKAYRVGPEHKMYVPLLQKGAKGQTNVKLADGNSYSFKMDEENNIILTAENYEKIKKESQTVSPKKVDSLADDSDITPVQSDKTHEFAADEKKPSEGLNEPIVPEAPNDGRLQNEHTVTKAKDGPEIPAGGGMNADYDQNEKNKPEKLDQMLGKSNEVVASTDEATKIAGQMLKANLISVDELPDTVRKLAKATPDILTDYRKQIVASESRGLQKEATAGAVESLPIAASESPKVEMKFNEVVQGLFTLNNRNEQYEKYMQQKTE